MNIPKLTMADGLKIPQIGLGLWKLTNPIQFQAAFQSAIEAGYRHFDTAQAYHNEALLGQAIGQSSIKREDLFITTKIAVQNFGDKKSRREFEKSLERLNMKYVDLLLLHFPVPVLRKKTWLALEDLSRQGLVKSIGVSNFTQAHLSKLKSFATQLPAVNQVEMHLFLQQKTLREYCQQEGILIEAYSPLAHARAMNNKYVRELATKYHVSYAQIMLRWLVEQSVVVIPKSAKPERIKQNIDIFNFKLSEEDLALLAQQDQGIRTCWNPEWMP